MLLLGVQRLAPGRREPGGAGLPAAPPLGARPPRALRLAAGARRRRVSRPPRRGPDDRRGLSVVHRLGPRHVHLAPRALPRHRPAGRGAVHSARVGGSRLGGDAAEPLRGSGRNAGVQHGGRLALVRRGGARLPACRRGAAARGPARDRRILGEAVRGDPRRSCARHPVRDPGGRGRPPRRGRARRAAHLDGREGRRLGRHPADRQAGGDPGALAQRASRRRRTSPRSTPSCWSGERARSPGASGTRKPAACTTWWTRTTSRAGWTARSGPTRSSRSAGCRIRCCAATPRGRWWTWSSGFSGLRSGSGRWSRARRDTGRATRAAS